MSQQQGESQSWQFIMAANRNLDVNKVEKLASFKKLRREFAKRKALEDNNNKCRRRFLSLDLIVLFILNFIFLAYLLKFFHHYYFESDLLDFNAELKRFYGYLVAVWFKFNKFDVLTKEPCAVPLPEFMNAITRPVNDCEMCTGLDEIPSVDFISKEEFVRNYAYTGVPLLVKNAASKWLAVDAFSFEFFKDLYSNKAVERQAKRSRKATFSDFVAKPKKSRASSVDNEAVDEGDTCQFFGYKTKFKSLDEVFNMNADSLDVKSKNLKPWYIGWSNCNQKATKILRKYYERPYFLPDNSEMSKTDWIFMGTPNYGANIHIDDVQYPSWQAQIKGVKLWTFKPPAECLLKCNTLEITVYPGDILVFDSNKWFHATVIIGEDISLTIGSEYD